jgi:hypothetical protein
VSDPVTDWVRGSESTVSLVLLSKNEAALSDTLSVLRDECLLVDAECVVVDASRGALDDVRTANPWVKWIDFVGPLGRPITIARQRNVGVRAASGSIIAFCDVGGKPERGWLKALTDPLRVGNADATCGAIRSADSPWMDSLNDLGDGDLVESVVTANVAFNREAFESVGGFDESFGYGSDVEFGWRLQEAGFAVRYAKHAAMLMTWGDYRREVKRARVQGTAYASLFLTHPERRAYMLRRWPGLMAYPAWLAGLPIALVGTAWYALCAPLWVATLALPIWHNRKRGTPLRVLAIGFSRAFGILRGLWNGLADDRVVLACERAPGVGAEELLDYRVALAGAAIPSQMAGTSRILGALGPAFARMRGVRIIHTFTRGTSPPAIARSFGVWRVKVPFEAAPTVDLDSPPTGIFTTAISNGQNTVRDRTTSRIALLLDDAPNSELACIIREFDSFHAPSGWLTTRISFGSRSSSLIGTRPRRSKKSGAAALAFRQDPFGAIADGWQPAGSSIAVLAGKGPRTRALAGYLASCRVVVVARGEIAPSLSHDGVISYEPGSLAGGIDLAIGRAESGLTGTSTPATATEGAIRWRRLYEELLNDQIGARKEAFLRRLMSDSTP